MKKRIRLWSCIQAVFLCLILVGFGNAQVANNTSLVGTVTDSAGGVITGVKILAVNVDTNNSYPTTTNSEGYYSINFIQAGTYNITAEQTGFSKTIQKGIVVQSNQTVRTDFALKVGSVAESVSVDATTPVIPTDDATLIETISTRSVSDLPLNGRDAMRLAATNSNVIVGPKSSMTGTPPGEDFIGAGQREITNSITLDGITTMNNLITVSAVTPNVDAVQEVQVQNGNYTAQYGSYMGVHVNLTSKSGTNNLHGSVFEFVRNDIFDAHPFFDAPGSKKKPLRFNQFGFALSGPVFLPKLYDGRNKTFFLASYEGLRQLRSSTAVGTTLTQAMRQGDFSALCPAGFNGSGVCNSFTGGNTQLYNANNGQPYANNDLSGFLSTPSQAVLQYLPLPNLPGITNNFNGAVPTNVTTNQTLERIDQTFGDKIRLFGRYDWQNMQILSGSNPPNPFNATSGPMRNRNIAFGYTHMITPNLVNDFRFGRNHLETNALNYFFVNGLNDAGTKLGIPGFDADTTHNNPGVPDFAISNYIGVSNAGSNWFQDDTTWHGFDQISYTHGKHNMMAGVELRKLTTGRAAANSPRGIFNFNGQMTQCNKALNASCPTQASGSVYPGSAAADFILGMPQNDITPINEIKGVIAEWRDGFFWLDNWQVTSKFTLNYGLRYELPTVPYSVNGFARILNPAQTALIPATTPQPGFKFINPNHDNWAPRIGFAYRITDKTVIRGGGGIYYNPNQMNSFTLSTTNPPFALTTTFNSSTGNVLTLDNPTLGSGTTPSSFLAVFTENPYLPTPRMYQWNLGAARELWSRAGFELQYLGSHSINLDRSFFNNQPVTLGPGSVNSLRPNQLWGQIRTIQNDETANYNGMTAIFRQRMSRGLQVLASYTWSHTLDMSTDSNGGGAPMNSYDIYADYGNANWDIRHRFVTSIVYELPKLASQNVFVRSVLGNWQINDITTLQSGQPYNITIAPDVANIGRGNQRPNIVGTPHANCNSTHRTNCIDAAAFALPTAFTFGDARRNILYGPSLLNTDFSLFKEVPFSERAKFQFRAEFFNLFNHPQLANPTSGGASAVFTPNQPFGSITSTVADNRDIQFGAKVIF